MYKLSLKPLLIPFFLLSFYWSAAQDRNWKFIKEDKQVKVYYSIEKCGSAKQIVLKVENGNISQTKAHLVLEFTSGSTTRLSPPIVLDLKNGEIMITDCASTAQLFMVPMSIKNEATFHCTVKIMNIQIL